MDMPVAAQKILALQENKPLKSLHPRLCDGEHPPKNKTSGKKTEDPAHPAL